MSRQSVEEDDSTAKWGHDRLEMRYLVMKRVEAGERLTRGNETGK